METEMVIRWSEEAMEYKDRCERAGFAVSAIMEMTEDNLNIKRSLNRVLSILNGKMT